MYRYSLRKRVAIAFAVCVAMLSVVWGFAFFAAIKLSEDRVLTVNLSMRLKAILLCQRIFEPMKVSITYLNL